MSNFVVSDLKHLVKLLNVDDQDSSDEDLRNRPTYYSSPASVSAYSNSTDKTLTCKSIEKCDKDVKPEISENIWSDDEILDEEYDESVSKIKPDYELLFQQSVTPDDIFLQLNDKGPGSNSCKSMLLKVQLGEIESSKDITLKITHNTVLCKTKKHYLYLDLPRHVNPVKCSAKWNQTENVLIAQLCLEEESFIKYE